MQLTNNDEMQSEKRPSPAEILDLGFARAKRNADRMMCDLLGADDRTTEGVSAGCVVPSNEFVVARDRASTTAVVTNGDVSHLVPKISERLQPRQPSPSRATSSVPSSHTSFRARFPNLSAAVAGSSVARLRAKPWSSSRDLSSW